MKLMTAEISKSIPPLRGQENVEDPIAYVKYFDPCGSWTWYVTEYDPGTGEMFGIAQGFDEEYGYFSLEELYSVKNKMGLGIERDLYFEPTPLSKIRWGGGRNAHEIIKIEEFNHGHPKK